jgi:acyl carrier protein
MNALSLDETKFRLKKIISQELNVNIRFEDIGDDVSLYEDGVGLDSISIINFVVLIESHFQISFGEDINAKMFSTINNLADYVHAKAAGFVSERNAI